MALHSRKVLLARTNDVNPQTSEKYPSHCYMCYICPGDCYTQPPPPPPLYTPSGSHYMSTLFILMLCTLGIIFLFLSYLTIGRFRASLRNSRRRNPGEFREDFLDENQGPVIDHPIWYARTVGLPQSIIDSISVFKYKRDEKMMEGRDCSVCLNEFQEDESLRLLPKCSHAFHQPCIDTWLRSHQNCPVCRAPIMISNVTNVPGNLLDTGRANLGSREENQHRAQNEEMETDETREMRGEPGSSTTMPLQEDLFFKIGCNLNTGNGSLRVLSDLTDGRARVDQELQRLRRSVSMDSSSVLMIYPAVANGCTKADEGCSDARQETRENQNSEMIGRRGCRNSRRKSSSSGRFLQKGPILMKRSFSFSGKRSLRKNNSRSPESVSIPGISTQNRGR